MNKWLEILLIIGTFLLGTTILSWGGFLTGWVDTLVNFMFFVSLIRIAFILLFKGNKKK